MAGRKPIYNPETLEIGQIMEIKGNKKKFGHQIAYSFNGRLEGRKFKSYSEGSKVFIKRES